VRAGDRVGVAALSGAVDPGLLEKGLEALHELGFEPVAARNLGARHGIFAGSDEQRLAAFHDLAEDPSLKAILFARGGHGVLRVLQRIDWGVLRRHPRAYLGYSDLTPFLLEVVQRLGLVAFHGPMVAADLARGLDRNEREFLLAALRGEYPATLRLEALAGTEPVRGPLLGGCLSLLASTLGTEFAPRLDGAIFFWEDDSEPLYRVDRMLNHLTLSGSLDGIAAMVVGRVDLADRDLGGAELNEHLAELAERHGWPLASGCASGHCRPNLTLPLGLEARLDPSGELIIGDNRERSP
jgi:muramoyltetrapeptide carboxypeptidase